ncbi:class I SAM-dependent methyltransferase [Kribbella sp. NPDC051587]|uniref:class I SAM-dependent methyltransferase n=1 Tax=Kribbella sp. NPDC051587 TaxID=3364119 RepID=UPI00378AE922
MKSVDEEYLDLDPLRVRVHAHQNYSERSEDVEADVIREAAIAGNDDLLDVGSGTGSFLGRLRAGGHTGRLTAVDTSPAAVEAARAACGEAHLGSATELPFEDRTFDVVAARHMLYHVDDPELAIAQARRVLKPGARFVATVNHLASTPYISEIVRAAAVSSGVELPVLPNSRVHSGNLPDMVRAVFGSVTEFRHDNALVFTEIDPLIRFGHSLFGFYGVAVDSPERPEVSAAVTAAVKERFSGLDGPWREPKGYVVCTATRGQDGDADGE